MEQQTLHDNERAATALTLMLSKDEEERALFDMQSLDDKLMAVDYLKSLIVPEKFECYINISERDIGSIYSSTNPATNPKAYDNKVVVMWWMYAFTCDITDTFAVLVEYDLEDTSFQTKVSIECSTYPQLKYSYTGKFKSGNIISLVFQHLDRYKN